MEGIILVGGLGTRLRSIVNDRPKPMAVIQDKPFVEYVMNRLITSGVTHVIFAVGYMGDMVESYFGNGEKWGIRISYAYEKELLGTAGAIKNAMKLATEANVLVLNGDTYYGMDYNNLEKVNLDEGSDLTLVLRHVEDVSRYGKAEADGKRLVCFNEKTSMAASGNINGGVYFISKKLVEEIPEGKVSLENDMIPKWIKEGRKLSAIVCNEYFIDIGIPEDYYRFEKDVISGAVEDGGLFVGIIEELIGRYPTLENTRNQIESVYKILEESFSNGGKLLIAGNGGSCADADHIVGELMKGFVKRRSINSELAQKLQTVDIKIGRELSDKLQGGLPAIALTNHAALTSAYLNDVDGRLGYAQQLNGYGACEDVFLGISTSGNAENVLYALVTAKAKGMKTVGLTGKDGGRMAAMADACIIVPESETYKIQELHLPIYHAICLMLEERFFA